VRVAISDAQGQILRVLSCPASQIEANVGPGESWIEVADAVRDDTHRVANGAPVAFPAKPSANHVFDFAANQWVDPRTLAQIKAQHWKAIKAERNAQEFGGFTWDGSTFDSDAISQSRVQGAAQLAQIAIAQEHPFAIDGSLAVNATRTLSAQQMIAVGVAMGTHIQTQHGTARVLRQQIEAAVSAQEVEAVAWPSGS